MHDTIVYAGTIEGISQYMENNMTQELFEDH